MKKILISAIAIIAIVTAIIIIKKSTTVSRADRIITSTETTKATNTPKTFLDYLQSSTLKTYKEKIGSYPPRWSDIRPLAGTIPTFNKDIKEGLNLPESNVLIAYKDYKKRDEWYKYTIERADENGYLIRTDNNAGIQNWEADEEGKWWRFKDKQEELDEINERKDILSSEKYLLFFSNHKRRRKAAGELTHFYSPKAFDIIFKCLKNPNENMEIKKVIAVNMKKYTPKLYRFHNYLPGLKKVLYIEFKRIGKEAVEEDTDEAFLFGELTELYSAISEKNLKK